MWCTQNFAFISDRRIRDIVVCDNYDVANSIARNIYGNDGIAIDVSHYNVQIDDVYTDGKFYRDGEEILPNPTVEDMINKLTGETINLEEASCDLSADYERRISDIEEALCELAEIISGRID